MDDLKIDIFSKEVNFLLKYLDKQLFKTAIISNNTLLRYGFKSNINDVITGLSASLINIVSVSNSFDFMVLRLNKLGQKTAKYTSIKETIRPNKIINSISLLLYFILKPISKILSLFIKIILYPLSLIISAVLNEQITKALKYIAVIIGLIVGFIKIYEFIKPHL